MEEYNTINIWQKFKQLPINDQSNPDLIAAMRHYDKTVNITWVMGHLNTAKKYIESGLMKMHNDHLILTREGKLLADGIAAALFF